MSLVQLYAGRIAGRQPWLPRRLVFKKARLVRNAVLAESRGDTRRYRKWSRANARFDCRNGPKGFQSGSIAPMEGV